MTNHYFKLDNPAWYALTEAQSILAVGGPDLKRYLPHIVAFAAYRHAETSDGLKWDEMISTGEEAFIIGELPVLPANYVQQLVLPCAQMIAKKEIQLPVTETIVQMGEADEQEMYSLVNEVQPGYFKAGSRLMGNYYGIRKQGRLVALAGERMRMNGLTEVSAVVTHPAYTGRKYAQQLVAHVVNTNLAAGIVPFLHVAEQNERAIGIYAHLGFVKRRSIPFTKIKRVNLPG